MADVFLKIVNMSIAASWLVLAVLVFRFVFKKTPKWIHVLLWGIVAVRLLCPFSIESALSLIPSAETISPEIMMDATPTIHTGIPAVNSVVNPVISEAFAPEPLASANPLQIWIPVLAVIWGIGVALLLAYTAISYWRLCRKVSMAVHLRDNIYQSETVVSPFVLGLIKPKIYLPFHMDGQNLEHVVSHEQAHIRRRDHWWKPLGFLLLTIHWFNPLMWLAYVLLCRDIELACDEKVVRELGMEQRADYSQALLACSVNRRMIAACPLAFGEVGVKERVKTVLNYKKPACWIVAAAMIACLVVAACFLTNPKGISIYDVMSEDGYTIINQEQVEITLSIPKGVLSDSIYTEEGQQFKEKEVIAYQTDETIIFLDEVRVSNESEDLLYFTFGYSLDLPKSGTVIVPFSVIKDGGSAAIYPDDSLISDSGTYADAIHMRGEHAGGFAFYVSADACKEAKGTIRIKGFCTKLTYAREGKEAELVDTEEQYYLLIGTDGVESIQVTGANSSGGVVNADGSAFKNGEKVWLEPLQGVTDLRGYSITALGKNGEILYALSIPEGATNDEVINLVGSDGWLLAPTEFEMLLKKDGDEHTATTVKWTYSPMMSATWHAAFHFNFDLDNYSHIDVSCDNGSLLNRDVKRQAGGEKTLRLEAGERFCWYPGIGRDNLTDTAENAKVTFTVYAGGEIVANGTLDIVRTGTENGQSFYEAQLTDTQILALAQESGSLEASVVLAGNGTIVSYSDVNHNRINERVIVREVHPGMLYELCVVEDGTVIWSTEASPAHTGWNTIMHYEENGESYFVEYQPAMFQGVGSYRCTVFSLDGGEKAIHKEWTVDFEFPAKETPEMERFAAEVGALLRNCSVLLSTEQGIVVKEYTMATALPQLYPVRFEPDEIQKAMEAAANPTAPQELTVNAAAFPTESLEFMFASGAGGWGTTLTLQPDGSFTGNYSDADMGSGAAEYPGGTYYVCDFSGRFTDIRQISDYSWSMKLESLATEQQEGQIWIEDNVRYIASGPHGLTDGEKFILYAPGTPADELPAEYRDWWPDAHYWRNGEMEQLEGWGLCNLNTGHGFFTCWYS